MTELYPDTNGIKTYSSNDPEYRALDFRCPLWYDSLIYKRIDV